MVGDHWSFIRGYYRLRGIDLVALFKEMDASETFDVCRQIIIEDAVRDAEVEGGITKIRAQLIHKDAKMYVESNPESAIELDPLESNWGTYDPSMDNDDGLVGPLN